MLHEFLIAKREEILGRSRDKLAARNFPTPTASELENGLPMFLDQLIGILRAETGKRGAAHLGVAHSAGLHGGELLKMGLTIGQVVQDYGSICQSVTALADESQVAITAHEFHTFNRCLDDAIAQAVTSYQHDRDQSSGPDGSMAQLGFLAHEMRNLLMTSMLTFDALSTGNVGMNGSTATLHGLSLRRMRALIDRTLSEVRLEAGTPVMEVISVATLIEEIEIVAIIEAKVHGTRLSIDAGPGDMAVKADRQILASMVANLVQNAFKFTRRGGLITVRASAAGDRVLIDVEDECGGLPPGKAENLFQPFKQQGSDKSGMGLGLAICLKGARASGGEIRVRDRPGIGCVFTVDLPRTLGRSGVLGVQRS